MPDQTTDVPEAAVERFAQRLYEEWSRNPLGPWPPDAGKSSGEDYAAAYRGRAREILDDLQPLLTAPLREELAEERRKRECAERCVRDAEFGAATARARADSAERRLEEVREAIKGHIERARRAQYFRTAHRLEGILATLQDSQEDREEQRTEPAQEVVKAAYEVASFAAGAGTAFVWVPVSKLKALRDALDSPTPEQPEEPTCEEGTVSRESARLVMEDAYRMKVAYERVCGEKAEVERARDSRLTKEQCREKGSEVGSVSPQTVSKDDSRVKKLLSFQSLSREDLAVLVVTGTDRGDQLERERDSRLTKEAVREKLRSPQMAERCAEEIGRRHPCRSTPIKQARAALDRAAAAFGDDQPSKGGGS